MFERETGKKVKSCDRTLIHDQYPFMIANIGGYLPEEKAIVEFKTCSMLRKKEFGDVFSDQIPYDFLFQVHHYLAVTGMNLAYVGVLFSDEKFGFTTMRNMLTSSPS